MREREEEKKRGTPGWLLTFGDLVTLLMTFFVLLISFASKDTTEIKEVMRGIAGSLGALEKDSVVTPDGIFGDETDIPMDMADLLEEGISSKPVLPPLEELHRRINERLIRTALNQYVDIELHDNELVMRIQAERIFKRNSEGFREKNLWILHGVTSLLIGMPNDIIISAPVDESFIPSKSYLSEFDLAVARSINICKYFIEKGRIAPGRLGVSEHGKYFLLSSGDGGMDRRWDYIEIRLLKTYAPLERRKAT